MNEVHEHDIRTRSTALNTVFACYQLLVRVEDDLALLCSSHAVEACEFRAETQHLFRLVVALDDRGNSQYLVFGHVEPA